MKFIGIRRVFSTQNEVQYTTIGAFWDNIPFCTMLFVEWNYQGKGYGKKLMEH